MSLLHAQGLTRSRPHGSYFSIVCLAFGIHLFRSRGGARPVGLIAAALAGTPIEYHMPSPALRSCTPLGSVAMSTLRVQWKAGSRVAKGLLSMLRIHLLL